MQADLKSEPPEGYSVKLHFISPNLLVNTQKHGGCFAPHEYVGTLAESQEQTDVRQGQEGIKAHECTSRLQWNPQCSRQYHPQLPISFADLGSCGCVWEHAVLSLTFSMEI